MELDSAAARGGGGFANSDTVVFIVFDRGWYYNGAKIVLDGGLNVNVSPA